MLYTLNGDYPTQIPFRIKLSDGRTRTDPTTFTAEEIADAGYTLVNNPPAYDSTYQVLGWTGTSWTVSNIPVSELREQRKSQLKDIRYQQEISHPTVDTSRQSQAMINGVWSAAQLNPSIIVNFKNKDGSWATLDATAIQYVANLVVTHVQACFNNEKILSDALDAANTAQSVLAVDLYAGWPTYE